MQFYVESTKEQYFNNWIKKIKKLPQNLSWNFFWKNLVPPSINNSISYFSCVEDHLFNDIVMSYMMPGFTASGEYLQNNDLKNKFQKLGYENVKSANWKIK